MTSVEKSILKVLGPESLPYVEEFLRRNKSQLKEIPLGIQLNTIGNYTHLLHNNDYSRLSTIDWKTLFLDYENYVVYYKQTFNTDNFTETNEVIWDGRVNEMGFYWIDLKTEYSIESMIRMEDCGRVNFGNTTLELREQTKEKNESHMIVVYEINSGNIKQIKGKQNLKPHPEYWKYLYELLINGNYKFNEYVPTYKPENDLLISELPEDLQFTIYGKHPNLKKLKKLT